VIHLERKSYFPVASRNNRFKKLTIVPLTTAKVHIDTATMAATFQFVDLIIVSSEGRLTDGPAIKSATAAPRARLTRVVSEPAESQRKSVTPTEPQRQQQQRWPEVSRRSNQMFVPESSER